MAATYGTGNLTSGTGAAPTLTVTLTSGQSVAFAIIWESAATFSSIGSALSNTYTIVGSEMVAFGARMRVYRAVNVTGGSETITVNLSGSAYSVRMCGTASGVSTTFGSGTGPVADAASPWTGTNVTPGIADAILFSFCTNDSTNIGTWAAGNGFTKTMEDGDGSSSFSVVMGYKIVSSTAADGGSWTCSQGTNADVWNIVFNGVAGAAPTLSAPTPSGTLGTTTTATTGATTDQNTGTFYSVLSTTNNVSTATATQIKAGQNSTGAAAAFASNTAVSTTSPSAGFSGLTAATGYFYASAQNNTNGDSNVVSGTFTTATASAGGSQARMLLGVG